MSEETLNEGITYTLLKQVTVVADLRTLFSLFGNSRECARTKFASPSNLSTRSSIFYHISFRSLSLFFRHDKTFSYQEYHRTAIDPLQDPLFEFSIIITALAFSVVSLCSRD